MEKLVVSSLPLINVISDIAMELETVHTDSCGIFSVDIPKIYGEGMITGTDFDNGLGLIRYDCTFHKDMVIEYSVDKVHPVKFIFAIEGEIRHKFIDESEWHEIPKLKNAIVASSSHHGHMIKFVGGERAVYSSLELDRTRFKSRISCEPVNIDSTWRNMLNDVTAKKTFYHDGFYSLELSKIIEDWDFYPNGEWLKIIHLESMALKILVLQITQFQDDLKSDGKKTMLRKAELKQMLKAIKLVEDHLDDLPTIMDIAAEVGLNENKLQQGFKDLFGKTANTFIQEKRLENVRTLLINTDETISNITAMVGYKSQSYLSKLFRETYGILPSEFRLGRRKRTLSSEFVNGNMEIKRKRSNTIL